MRDVIIQIHRLMNDLLLTRTIWQYKNTLYRVKKEINHSNGSRNVKYTCLTSGLLLAFHLLIEQKRRRRFCRLGVVIEECEKYHGKMGVKWVCYSF
jgi:hypothetical protein